MTLGGGVAGHLVCVDSARCTSARESLRQLVEPDRPVCAGGWHVRTSRATLGTPSPRLLGVHRFSEGSGIMSRGSSSARVARPLRRFRFRTSVAIPVLVLVLAAAGGVVAATQSSDEQALQQARQPADRAIEAKVNDLLSKMTLQEKLEQIQLLPDFLVTEQEV